MKYQVEGKITIDVFVDVEADNEKSAELLARNALDEAYHLKEHGNYHTVGPGVKYELEVFDGE